MSNDEFNDNIRYNLRILKCMKAKSMRYVVGIQGRKDLQQKRNGSEVVDI